MPTINVPIIKSLKEEFAPYSAEIILNNLPMIDGLLLAHKKVLWGMSQKGVYPNKPFVKNIKNQGYIVEYYVYGDMPLAKVMVNMANNSINIPYLDWDGNSGDKFRKKGRPASARYTGSKTTDYGMYMLKGIEKDAVPMKPNYDNSHIEPVIAPSIAPNILLNNSLSIAVSEASKIPPHNTNSLCNSITEYINTKDIDKAIEILQCPDFCNKGKIVYDKKTFEKIYKEGNGSFSLVGRYTYDKDKSIMYITEVPYTTTIDAIESAIIEKYDKGILFKEVLDTRDASGKDGLRLEIKLKKNTNIEVFEKLLRSETPFESKYSCNFTILGLDYIPYLMNLQGIYDTWIQHRINCIKNETQFDMIKNAEELNRLYGLKIINEDLDKAIQIIRSSKTEKIAVKNLIEYFKLNQKQAEYIATIRLLNINQEWIDIKINNILKLEKENTKLDIYYNSEKSIIKTIISQLEEVKEKFGKDRLTEIIYAQEDIIIEKSDLVEDYNPTIVLTSKYIKKTRKYSDTQKLTEDDEVLQMVQCNNKDDILLFTNLGNCISRKVYELKDWMPSEFGTFIQTWLGEYLQKDEKVIYILTTNDWSENLISVFSNGNISKMNLAKSKPLQNRQVAIKNIFNTDSPLMSIMATKQDIDVLMITQSGHGLIINTGISDSKPINAVNSKNGKGVTGIKLDTKNMSDDKVIGVLMNVNIDDSITLKTVKSKEIYTVLNDVSPNKNGNLYDYLKGNRGALGNMLINLRKSKDKIIEMAITK